MTLFFGGKMKNMFLALLIVCGLAPLAQADINDNMGNADTSYVRPGPRPPGRPDPYPGPGPVRPDPRPEPRPNPGYPPYPPPPNYVYEHVTCTSYNYRYNECYFNDYRLVEIRIWAQHSYDACIWGRTAGVYGNRLWVDRGCSATFEIVRYY